MGKTLIIISLALVTFGCGNASSNGSLSRDELRSEIIAQVLQERCGDEIGLGVTLVINSEFSADRLKSYQSRREFSKNLIEQSRESGGRFIEAAQNFVAINFESLGDGAIPNIPFPHALYSYSVMTKTIGNDMVVRDWQSSSLESALRDYPGTPGLIGLSEPGISEDGSVAMIYLEMIKLKGSGCSGGDLYVFELIDGEWVYVENKWSMGWVS